jgi:hypothetical protein
LKIIAFTQLVKTSETRTMNGFVDCAASVATKLQLIAVDH